MKKREKALRGGLWLLLCAALIVGALSLRPGAPPRQEIDAASRMLVSSSELLYDADGIAQTDSAAISGQPETTPAQEQTPQEGQETQPAPDAPPEEQPGEQPDSDAAGDSGMGDLLDIGSSGGGSGGQTPARQPSDAQGSTEVGDADRYFETSIIDGDVVDYERYTFTIRHLKPELQVLGLTVTLNGQALDYRAATSSVMLKLAEGANTILVQALYRNGSDTITASQGYTVYYGAGGEVLIVATRDSDGASLADIHTTADGDLAFTAYGLKDGSRLRAAVSLNGKALSGSGDSFRAALTYGTNTLDISAGGRNDTVTKRFVIEYREDGFKITNSFNETVIDNDTHQADNSSEELAVWLDSEEFRFRFYLNQETGAERIRQVRYDNKTVSIGGDGWYTVTLDTRRPKTLSLHYTDADGENRIYKWTVRFHRNAEATPEEKKPVINATLEVGSEIIGLENGLTLKSPDVITVINSVSWNHEQLYLNNYQVWVNGQEIYSPCSQTGSSFGYETYLTNEGANTITITATDPDGYAVTQSWTVYYEKGDVTVTVSVEATTVGLGYLVPPTEVTVPGGTDLAAIFTQLLEDTGYTCSISRGYLSAIHKVGICEGFHIDEELMELIVTDGMDDIGAGFDPQPASPDSLGEFDFYRWSGWMYSYNGRYPGYGLSACKPQDGAVIRLRFTLALGKDIGGFSKDTGGTYGNSGENYYKEW